MSVLDRPSPSLGSLNEKEREILRLLTAGHTVKTIATRLGRSEASINERLREARRKTGVGSSRELARLLDAQKNCDKNIDLAARDHAADGARQPTVPGRTLPKGQIMMLFTLPIAAAGLALATTQPSHLASPPRNAAAELSAQPALVGNWSLEVDKIPAEERPQSVTIAFRVSPDHKWTAQVTIVAPDGSRQYAESTASTDGVPVPISGNMAFIDSVSLRQPAADTLVMTLGKNGAPVSTRVYTAAKDRKSMTETIVWAGTDMPKLETTFFRRID